MVFLSSETRDAILQSENETASSSRKRKRPNEDFDLALLRHLQGAAERRSSRQNETSDEDHFGRHVACVLKRLDSRTRARIRLRIEQLLVDAELSN